MLSRKRFFQVFGLIGLGLTAIGGSSPVEFGPVQAARLDSGQVYPTGNVAQRTMVIA